MNELARTLSEQGKKIEAIAMLELNAEFYPDSPAIGMALGDLYRERGDRDRRSSDIGKCWSASRTIQSRSGGSTS
jgi:lipopolysaccharide biosynthesis regulator YciM